MTWDKPITADGATATPEQLQAAWEAQPTADPWAGGGTWRVANGGVDVGSHRPRPPRRNRPLPHGL
jgi:hypothetical protein